MFKRSLSVVGLWSLAMGAYAAVPASVTTALGDAETDSTAVAALAIGIIVAIAAFKYMRRAIG
jgi:hypothetical protein